MRGKSKAKSKLARTATLSSKRITATARLCDGESAAMHHRLRKFRDWLWLMHTYSAIAGCTIFATGSSSNDSRKGLLRVIWAYMRALGHFWGLLGVSGLWVWYGYHKPEGDSGLFGVRRELWDTFGGYSGLVGVSGFFSCVLATII